ncbi:BufA1 family periplasmic bufferin-type metallophore [Inquilinus limosus]|uniref:BufA1 family periplasmic bufferin-type metallophore n=1 Tax=Inquilinus limosus TaxID=171674 RepID=UPI003F5CDC5B
MALSGLVVEALHGAVLSRRAEGENDCAAGPGTTCVGSATVDSRATLGSSSRPVPAPRLSFWRGAGARLSV